MIKFFGNDRNCSHELERSSEVSELKTSMEAAVDH